jgi:hypothetical protein
MDGTMAHRENHYEAAFEAFVRSRQMAYVAVDESRRALWGDGSLKSLDYIVTASQAGHWLVDVKGRRFPSGRQKQYWKNWSTADDLRSLTRWEAIFGKQFHGLLVFVYWIVGEKAPLPAEQLFAFDDRLYALLGVGLGDYAASCRRISQRWGTVAVPAPEFRQLAQPLERIFGLEPAVSLASAATA